MFRCPGSGIHHGLICRWELLETIEMSNMKRVKVMHFHCGLLFGDIQANAFTVTAAHGRTNQSPLSSSTLEHIP